MKRKLRLPKMIIIEDVRMFALDEEELVEISH